MRNTGISMTILFVLFSFFLLSLFLLALSPWQERRLDKCIFMRFLQSWVNKCLKSEVWNDTRPVVQVVLKISARYSWKAQKRRVMWLAPIISRVWTCRAQYGSYHCTRVCVTVYSRLQLRWFHVPGLRGTLGWSKTAADHPDVWSPGPLTGGKETILDSYLLSCNRGYYVPARRTSFKSVLCGGSCSIPIHRDRCQPKFLNWHLKLLSTKIPQGIQTRTDHEWQAKSRSDFTLEARTTW